MNFSRQSFVAAVEAGGATKKISLLIVVIESGHFPFVKIGVTTFIATSLLIGLSNELYALRFFVLDFRSKLDNAQKRSFD